ncbi:TPA: PBECR4 domain-containing protein [Streptococcus suis]
MSEEQTRQFSPRGKSRRERVEYARSRAILEVANELQMELFRSGRDYRWKEHDSLVISPDTNLWNWFGERKGGDVISLVEVIKDVQFNQAIDYLNDGSFKEYTAVERVKEPFSYYLKPYEQPFEAARDYLKHQRGLSDDTIDFFLDKGVLAQANAKVNGSIEPVIVFKSVDFSGEIVGATLQGIEENWAKWPERGYAKNIVRNSDGITGMHVDIGQPNRLIFSESPIDLMSYYELHKNHLQDVRLISMDGLKEGVIGRHLSQLLLEVSGRPIGKTYEQLAESLQTAIDHNFFADGKNAGLITLAVDNDKGGRNLIRSLQKKGATVNVDIPILASSKEKRDWNEELQEPSTSVEEGCHLYRLDEQKQEVRYEGYFTSSEADRRLQALSEQGILGIVSRQVLQESDLPALTQEAWREYQRNETNQSPKTAEEHYFDWIERMAATVQEQLQLPSPPKLASELEAVVEPFLTTDVDRLFARRLSLALDTQRVESSQILSIHQAIDQLDKQISERIQEELLHEVPVVDSLSTVEKQDVLTNIQVSDRNGSEEAAQGQKEKSLEINQETNTGGELLNRNSSFLGESSPGTAPQPVEQIAQPDFPTNVHLHFTTDDGNMSNKAFRKNLRTLNLYANTMRDSAQWYLSEVADTTMSYIYKTPQKEEIQVLSVHFSKKNWMHLTGVTPVYENWADSLSEQFIDDVANGKGHFKNLKFALGTPDKLKVLNLFPEIIESDTFVFNDLSSVQKLNNLDLSQAITPEDSDLLLLFRDEGLHQVPASLMRIKGELEENLSNIDSGTVLGVYRERNGQLEQLSINEEYVKDGGQEMLTVLQNKRYEEPLDSAQEMVQTDIFSVEDFTQVLDTAYYVGDPKQLGTPIPEESTAAWERFYELSDAHEGNFTSLMELAEQLGLVDKESNFYQEWNQDRIYNENYHVRLQSSETWPDAPQIPFKETELIDYETFAKELYKQNRAFYERHHESIKGNQTESIAFTKVTFDVYAPGGTLIKDNVRYNVGDETEPISRLLGLGYRRLEGQPELAAIDEKVLSQLEKLEVNREIAAEANEQGLKAQEGLPDELSPSREKFPSPNQVIKDGLAQKVEEIVAENTSKMLASSIPHIQENLSVGGDLMGISQTGGQMLYTNREDFGQDYQLELAIHSPKAIDFLEDVEAPWTLSLIKGEEQLGYVAYGSDWAKEFQIEEELEQLAAQIGDGKVPEGLYKQAEVDAFLAHHLGNEKTQTTLPTELAEPFDYTSASAYDISEHAFQKIREYTQSPKDLKEYMDFMSQFPQLSPRNVALIQEQWPGANAVATYDQWKAMGEALGLTPDDVIHTKAVYTNKRTGETREVLHQGLSVKTGEKSQITLFRPLMTRMIPVLDENGNQLKNEKGNPKYKKLSEATPQEKALVKEGKLPVKQFQERDRETGQPRFTTYKVFELSQTTLKPENYPKAMPNRHYNFQIDHIKTKEVLEGLRDYASAIGVTMIEDKNHLLGNAKGAFYPGEQLIRLNPDNTPGEKIATTIHELAHATLHNPKLKEQYKELPREQRELEAEMTSYLVSKHFGLDTSEKAMDYIAKWTDNLTALDDRQLGNSLKRIHQTVAKMVKQVEHHTKPYQQGKQHHHTMYQPNHSRKGPSR